MKTLNYPRRAMRPHPGADYFPDACAWCGKPVPRRTVFTRGKDLGNEVIVCGACLTPPKPWERLTEVTVDEHV